MSEVINLKQKRKEKEFSPRRRKKFFVFIILRKYGVNRLVIHKYYADQILITYQCYSEIMPHFGKIKSLIKIT